MKNVRTNRIRYTRCAAAIVALLVALTMLGGCTVNIHESEGKSAYDIAVKNGFEGSEAEWLESLKGSDGKDGADGKDGKDGKDGEAGKDGEDGEDGSMSDGAGDVYQTYIELEGESDVSAAASLALRSTVSVSVEHTARSSGSIWWGQQPTQEYTYTSQGSGVIYHLSGGDAFVITNYHVVYSADSVAEDGIGHKIELYLFGATDPQAAIPASYVGGSMYYDLALLHVQDSDVLRESCAVAATLGDSDTLTAGQRAIAVGNPEGGGLSVTSGIVSVASEYLTMTAADEATPVNYRTIRVDTPINSGNSGGGLYNAKGELIGVVNAKLVSTSVENIGFAIPSAIVKGVAENILDHCYEKENRSVMRAIVGLQLVEEDTRMVVDEESGALLLQAAVTVDSVSEGGAAEGLIEAGDVLLAVTVGETRTEVTRSHHVIDAMLYAREGETVVLEIERAGQRRTVRMDITPECMRAY